jgi:hypothetical protein
MNSKQLAVLTGSVALASVGVLTNVQLFNNVASITAINANHEELGRQASALTQQIAQVEVAKILQGEIYRQDTPVIVQLKEQQSNLEKRLAELQPDRSQRAVSVATASAIESEIADLEVQNAQDQAKFLDSHPVLQVRKAQIEALRQRLTTLQ